MFCDNLILILKFLFCSVKKDIIFQEKNDKRELKEWLRTGLKNPPPDIVKHSLVTRYAKKERIKTLIGSGGFILSRYMLFHSEFLKIIIFGKNNDTCKHVVISFSEVISLISTLKQIAVIWVDTLNIIDQNNRSKAEEQIRSLLNAVTCAERRHVLLWDNADMFYSNPFLPKVQEIKAWLLE
ncbi:MAG: hypothetical protein NTW13_01975, partial [Candidatus Omnitrophica bacterium]|nr:hypothetical protein [Candidatus Omnitrophota bacterium]